jgi:hypothetical protein
VVPSMPYFDSAGDLFVTNIAPTGGSHPALVYSATAVASALAGATDVAATGSVALLGETPNMSFDP